MTVFQLARGGQSYTARGESEHALVLEERYREAHLGHFLRSISLGEPYWAARSALREVSQECSSDNWDGYGARAVLPRAAYHARRFLEMLSPGFPLPEVNADPDGEISFEWYDAPRRVFSISIGSSSRVSYAGDFGRRSVHGTEYLGDELPTAIVTNLNRLLR